MKYKLALSLAMSFLMLAIAQAAENGNETPENVTTDTFMLVTDSNTPDLMAASAAAVEEGIPVLTTDNQDLDDNITEILNESQAQEVILVGGPAVIPEDVETKLRGLGYRVRRLWGIERTKTAIEIAKHFWTEADCAVLVEDTFKPSVDSPIQAEAVSYAIRHGCPLMPIPKGEVPAEVLDALSDLNVSNVVFVGTEITDEMKDDLDGFNLTEIVGNWTQIRNKIARLILNKTSTMLIVATPNWNESTGWGLALDNTTYVRRVTSVDDVPEIIDIINEYNITHVHIVGNPFLAGQAYNELQNAGITAIRYDGHKPAAIAKRIWTANKKKIHNRRVLRKAIRISKIEKWKNRIMILLNETRSELEELRAEIESLNADGANTTELETAADEADELLNQAEWNSTTDVDNALRLLYKAKNRLMIKLWAKRNIVNWNWREKLNDELHNRRKIAQRINIAAEKAKLPQFLSNCGASGRNAIKSLLDKAESLKTEADAETDPAKKAALIKEAKMAYEHAKKLGNVCIKKKVIASKIINKAAEQIKRLEAKKTSIKTRVARILRRLR